MSFIASLWKWLIRYSQLLCTLKKPRAVFVELRMLLDGIVIRHILDYLVDLGLSSFR